MARPSWTGAITFAGFPINVRAYPLIKSRAAQSFKTLAPNGLPVKQVLVDSDGAPVEREDCAKGVEVAKGKFSALPPEAVEMISNAERSTELEVQQFALRDSVPLHLATGHFRLTPDPKVPGAEGPCGILWNGLRATERVLITEWVPRSGSRDSLCAVHGDVYGLTLNTIPYRSEMQDVPEWAPEENEDAAAMFGKFIEAQGYNLDDFAWTTYESSYEQRRSEAVQKALAGEVIEAPETPTPEKAAVPDLMAAMAASLEAAPQTAKKKGGKKAPAKAKAKAA